MEAWLLIYGQHKDNQGLLQTTLCCKFEHLDETYQFFEEYKLSKFTKEEIDGWNSPVCIKEIEVVSENLKKEKKEETME